MLQRHRITVEDNRTLLTSTQRKYPRLKRFGNCIFDTNRTQRLGGTGRPNVWDNCGKSRRNYCHHRQCANRLDRRGWKADVNLSVEYTHQYSYVLAEAYIENVTITDDRICFEYVDNHGQLTPIKSFKMGNFPRLRNLHKTAIEYFMERDGSRAFFSICIADNYADGLLAESVTAISLQLMRRGIKRWCLN